jgi:hypothetical protein
VTLVAQTLILQREFMKTIQAHLTSVAIFRSCDSESRLLRLQRGH